MDEEDDVAYCSHCKRPGESLTRALWCSFDCRLCDECMPHSTTPDDCYQACVAELIDEVKRAASLLR